MFLLFLSLTGGVYILVWSRLTVSDNASFFFPLKFFFSPFWANSFKREVVFPQRIKREVDYCNINFIIHFNNPLSK